MNRVKLVGQNAEVHKMDLQEWLQKLAEEPFTGVLGLHFYFKQNGLTEATVAPDFL